MSSHSFVGLSLFLSACALTRAADPAAVPRPPVRFDTAFEAGLLERVERVTDDTFRLHIGGQHDERGRNRQVSWFCFRMHEAAGRDLTLTFTGYAPFEYFDRPAPAKNGFNPPAYSYDGETWAYFTDMAWDDKAAEATVRFRPGRGTVWIATTPPYPHSRVVALLAEAARSPHARVESIGRTVLGRDLPLLTVTDFAVPDAGKRTVWLMARQHAWESLTSWIAEGAIRFVLSDAPRARELRAGTVFVFSPMLDPDGCALGGTRFNRLGYDLGMRNWENVDLRDPAWLQRLPETWYVKKAVRDQVATRGPVHLLINLHNTLTEYLDASAPTNEAAALLERFSARLIAESQYDPSRPLRLTPPPAAGAPRPWWAAYDVPYALLESRVVTGRKLGTPPSIAQRLAFGRELITVMAESVRASSP